MRAHMLNQIAKHECLNDYLFIHEGDIDAISLDIQNKYFGGDLKVISPNISCAYTLLYKKLLGRTTGAYIIDLDFAQSLVQEVLANKCNLPIDWFHNYCSSKDLIHIYWAHPVLSTQRSLNGKLSSMIDNKKTGRFRVLTFRLSRFYKRLLYKLR
jgi:hypothetical protein